MNLDILKIVEEKNIRLKNIKKLILKFKEEKIENKTIIEHETELSVYNRKTLGIKNFKIYSRNK
jgi:hypothetical protein